MPTLPAGHGSLPTEATRFLQRARILDATAQTVAEDGYAATSADRIRRRAGVSSRTFYEHFTDKQDAVLWAFDAAATFAVPRIVAAFAEQDVWAAGVDAALQTYLAIMDCDRAWAVLCVVELPGVATGAGERRDVLLAPLIAALSATQPRGALVPAADVVAAVDGVVRERLLRDGDVDLQGLRPELLALALSPYVGAERAQGFIDRKPAAVAASVDLTRAGRAAELVDGPVDALAALVEEAVAQGDGPALWRVVLGLHDRRARGEAVPWRLERRVLDGLAQASFFGMPVRDMEAAGWGLPTPRERVLRYVAAHPGCSGQEIRVALGFAHLSQVSRMLQALRDEGLVARRAPRGRANAWVAMGSEHSSGNTKRDIGGS
ncbi:TetR family transcriptional regulator [Baekduia sp.]|jgi:AcrR family transcriptional regulator|uniref:TetR family transcriptional regulator n=1 Tax=Baekduia sp. TaxID=2600305 RepID=UPI002DF87C35|nr:TetR family transcriptional regulator [Baekduia sp.]